MKLILIFFPNVDNSTVYPNLIITLQKKKKQTTQLLNTSESYFYSACQGYVVFQCMKVVLLTVHFLLLIFVRGSTLSTVRGEPIVFWRIDVRILSNDTILAWCLVSLSKETICTWLFNQQLNGSIVFFGHQTLPKRTLSLTALTEMLALVYLDILKQDCWKRWLFCSCSQGNLWKDICFWNASINTIGVRGAVWKYLAQGSSRENKTKS